MGVATVSDGDDAHGRVVAQLVDDAVDADAERTQAGEPSPQWVPDARLALEFAELIEDGIRE